MNEPQRREDGAEVPDIQRAASGRPPEASNGPSLKKLYTALFLALALAIGIALLIVLPFYHRT